MFILFADREAQHGGVVQLMDLAKNAGFEKLAIATEKQE
jgi:biopolymer transport protein ExbD